MPTFRIPTPGLKLETLLELPRCPHCNVDSPRLEVTAQFETKDYAKANPRAWYIYVCGRCGGVVTAAALGTRQNVTEIYPEPQSVDGTVPERARAYLEQALNSLSSPAGSIMLSASGVDAMLKAKGLRDGSLYSRIDAAARDHLITSDMAKWAHQVRLDANEQRHSEESAPLPEIADARRSLDFALALAQFLFVLPARVQRGIEAAKPGTAEKE